jgi:hypothetical protein
VRYAQLASSVRGTRNIYKIFFEHQKGGDHMENRVLDERLILKKMLILGKGCGIHAAQDGY